ncbi:MAG: LLM class flavin-dependent oxidoreductase [Candidatus Bathyarchaeia archaeon]|jgi:alkanesulfonate monooxygenase SsuD/methylene tetrahydromethanopterin reductase-like flavin-dependent oxidoreductase (luciferase family)
MAPKFGCILPHDLANFDHLLEVAKTCEVLGYDSIWAFDHLAPYWSPSKPNLECWTTLSSIAGHTKEIKLGSLVININLRHPSLLAKMASTLDVISRGRIILGLGTGDRLSKDELTSFGYTFRSLDERISHLRETIQILNGLWTTNDFSYDGVHFKLSHAQLEPKPVQKPHPPIWIGGKHYRILDAVAEMADGWNYWNLTRKGSTDKIQYLLDRCLQNNRSFDSIVKSWSGTIPGKPTVETLMAYLKERSGPATEYFVAYFGSGARRETYELFAETVSKL